MKSLSLIVGTTCVVLSFLPPHDWQSLASFVIGGLLIALALTRRDT